MKIFKKEYSKRDIIDFVKKYSIIIFANFLVAFGTGVFIVPMGICAGGLSGIGVIIDGIALNNNWQITGYVDLTIAILTWTLMIFSIIFLGKKFTLNTLLSSIFFPAFLSLVYRVPFFQQISAQLVANKNLVDYLLAALFGGGLVGAGVALSFSAGASTGGIDILAFLFKKMFPKLNMSHITFTIDALIIFSYMVAFWDNSANSDYFAKNLMNILCAIVSALFVEFVYVARSKNLLCEVVSDKWEEINRYIQDELERGSTTFEAKGGYKGTKKVVVRVVISMKEYNEFYDKIIKIDPNAFVTFTMTKSVIGNGFSFQEGDEPLITTVNKLRDKDNSKDDGKNQ